MPPNDENRLGDQTQAAFPINDDPWRPTNVSGRNTTSAGAPHTNGHAAQKPSPPDVHPMDMAGYLFGIMDNHPAERAAFERRLPQDADPPWLPKGEEDLPDPLVEAARAAGYLPPPRPQREFKPEESFQFADADRAVRYAQGALRDEVALVASATDGSRNHTLFQAAANLRRYIRAGALNEADVTAALTDAARHAGLEDREIGDGAGYGTIASGYRKDDATGLREAVLPERETPGPAAQFDPGEGSVPQDADWLAGIRSGDWLDEQAFAPLEYIVPGVLPEGASLLSAAPKTGKSWLALLLALEVADGGYVLGQPVKPRPVLYFALEDGHRRIKERARALWGDRPLPKWFHYMLEVDPQAALPTVQAFLDRFPDERPLVIVDTLGRIKPQKRAGDEAYLSDYQFAHRLRGVIASRPGAGLLAVHHTRKAEVEDFVEAATGTMGLAGAFDSVLVLRRKRHENTGVLLVSGRDVEEGRYALRVDDGHWYLNGPTLVDAARLAEEYEAQTRAEAKTARFGDRTKAVLKVVQDRAAAGQGTTPSDIVRQTKFDQRVVANKLKNLVERGLVERTDYGAYTTPTPLCQNTGVVGVPGVVPVHHSESSTPLPESTRPGTTPTTPLIRYRGRSADLADLPGRCAECGWHVPTQGHRDPCLGAGRPA